MYEIWLAMNIVWEIALTAWPWLLALGVLIVVLWAIALQRGRAPWGATFGMVVDRFGTSWLVNAGPESQ